MPIAIAGGTGWIGKLVVDAARERGHTPRQEELVLAGPEERQIVEMTRRVSRRRGLRKVMVPIPAGRAMRRGGLLPTGPGPRGVETFEQWLAFR